MGGRASTTRVITQQMLDLDVIDFIRDIEGSKKPEAELRAMIYSYGSMFLQSNIAKYNFPIIIFSSKVAKCDFPIDFQ